MTTKHKVIVGILGTAILLLMMLVAELFFVGERDLHRAVDEQMLHPSTTNLLAVETQQMVNGARDQVIRTIFPLILVMAYGIFRCVRPRKSILIDNPADGAIPG